MATLASGLRTISFDDTVTCPECGHANHLVECIVEGWMHEMNAGETEVQFVRRFFDWREEEEANGEVECVCGELLQWRSPPGTMDAEPVA